jgi:biotin operon repressor
MQANDVTVRPESLDALRETFNEWLPAEKRSGAHTEYKRGRLVLRSGAFHNVRFRFSEEGVALTRGNRHVFVALDNFAVDTEGQGRHLCFVFTLRRSAASRPMRESLRSIENTEHPVFYVRALHALKEIEQVLSKEKIEEATAAPNDCMVLLNALTASPVATQLGKADPLAAARLRGVQKQQALLEASGGTLSVGQTAEVLGISRQAVDKRRRQGQLIGLTQGRRGYAYPAWQFENGRTLPHVEEVLDLLDEHDPWMQLSFFLNANDRLNGKSPLDALREGQAESVQLAARSFGEHGAA